MSYVSSTNINFPTPDLPLLCCLILYQVTTCCCSWNHWIKRAIACVELHLETWVFHLPEWKAECNMTFSSANPHEKIVMIVWSQPNQNYLLTANFLSLILFCHNHSMKKNKKRTSSTLSRASSQKALYIIWSLSIQKPANHQWASSIT